MGDLPIKLKNTLLKNVWHFHTPQKKESSCFFSFKGSNCREFSPKEANKSKTPCGSSQGNPGKSLIGVWELCWISHFWGKNTVFFQLLQVVTWIDSPVGGHVFSPEVRSPKWVQSSNEVTLKNLVVGILFWGVELLNLGKTLQGKYFQKNSPLELLMEMNH